MSGSEVSRTLALAWGLAAAPQRGPKRELSLERIVDAAIEIADAEGLSAVTMQRVASVFDFSTMALYRYVSTKDDLYQLMLDAAMSRALAELASESWQDGLRELLRGLASGYRRHPWTLDIPLTPDIHMMPGQMRVADVGLRAMRDLQAPPQTKLAILMLVSAFARGHAEVEREVLADSAVDGETRALIEEAVGISEFPDVGTLVKSGLYFGQEPAGDAPQQLTVEEEADMILGFAIHVLVSGLEQSGIESPDSSEAGVAEVQLTPQESFELAETRLREHKELRKRTQQRVRQLEREEAALQKARDRAKELAKAHAKLAQEGTS